MNDDINRAIRKAARREQAPPQPKEVVGERQPNAVMNDILRAAAGVRDDSEPPATNGNSAKENQ